MATINKFKELESLQKAREMNKIIWNKIKEGNYKNLYKFQNQITGSIGSVMDNIAEGFERGSTKEFIQFLGYAKGSCAEFRSQIHRSFDMDCITDLEYKTLINECDNISGKIKNFIVYLNKSEMKGERFLNRDK
jgi:four helix bundle protein